MTVEATAQATAEATVHAAIHEAIEATAQANVTRGLSHPHTLAAFASLISATLAPHFHHLISQW